MSEVLTIATAEQEIDMSLWKELTSRAAYLQGFALEWPQDDGWKPYIIGSREIYAPLEYDGQSFRLANQLIMRIEHGKNHKHVYNRVTVSVQGRCHVGAEITYKSDRNEAMRRAIVLTAYELYRDG